MQGNPLSQYRSHDPAVSVGIDRDSELPDLHAGEPVVTVPITRPGRFCRHRQGYRVSTYCLIFHVVVTVPIARPCCFCRHRQRDSEIARQDKGNKTRQLPEPATPWLRVQYDMATLPHVSVGNHYVLVKSR